MPVRDDLAAWKRLLANLQRGDPRQGLPASTATA